MSQERDIELRFVIRTDMPDSQLDQFVIELTEEINSHMILEERVMSGLFTEKVSYESRQLTKELGVV